MDYTERRAINKFHTCQKLEREGNFMSEGGNLSTVIGIGLEASFRQEVLFAQCYK